MPLHLLPPNFFRFLLIYKNLFLSVQSAGAIEYTDCISAEGQAPPPHYECPGYDTKQSDGEAPVQELWGMGSTPSLPLLPGPLWFGMVAPDSVVSMG